MRDPFGGADGARAAGTGRWRRPPAGRRELTAEQAAALRHARARPRAARRVQDRAAARRDRQRQDGAVPAAGGAVVAQRPARAGARAGDRADAGGWRGCSARASARASRFSTAGSPTGERHDQWHRIRRGDVDVVVGTRSAVFAPLERARPHRRRRGARVVVQAGRVAALSRPRRRGRARADGAARSSCSGSATPSLESAANARAGRYDLRPPHAARARPAAGRPCASSTCGRSTRRTAPTSRSARPLVEAIERSAGAGASRRSCCSTGAASRR